MMHFFAPTLYSVLSFAFCRKVRAASCVRTVKGESMMIAK